ncbi:MAG TPA: protease pro-enzyme activation domain-containing protein [Ktedonobacteraceae bacterium]|nr:protease pro-enzyme activation domain-containing protein [Ktedonobacteraceae bacterium]
MQRNVARNILFIVTSLLLIGGSLLAMRVAARADQNQPAVLSGQVAPLIQQAQLLQAASPYQQLSLSLGLQPRNAPQLDALLSAIYDPQSSQYQQYLTSAQFESLFAPTPDQAQQVVSYLQSQGMTVTSIAPNNLLIDATGTVAQVEQAFSTTINNYQLGSQLFYANAAPPVVPAAISSLITSIGGLDNSVQYQPLYQHLLHSGRVTTLANGPITGFGPKDLTGAYDATPLQSSGILGDNQTVALFELDGYQPSDVTQYFSNYGIATPNISNVLVDNYSGAAGQGAIEVELDIEVLGAMAPHANQVVYEGPNTTQGLNDTYNQIVHDHKAQIVSISWGLCESSTGPAELQTLDNIFKQGAAEGISFFAASGDSGAYDCGDSNLAVDSPASDPYVTGVGGTNLQLNAGAYGSESVWSNPNDTQRSPKGAGDGGGVSSTYLMQSWQTGQDVINQNSSGAPCNAPGGKYCREVPDVSADADPASGYAVYCTVTNAGCSAAGWLNVGGTSAAAPLWAGSMALINQYVQSKGKAVVGFANPALYGLFNAQQSLSAFHDVTSGNNLYYPAATGYDMASGLGSPDINNLAQDLALGSSGGPTPTPSPTNTPSPTVTSTPSPSPTSPTPTTTPSPTPAPASIIQNGGFENGQTPWQESSSGGYQIIQNLNAHSGSNSAYLCGYSNCDDRIYQTFTVPASYTKLTISYWWYSDTNKNTRQCQDTFNSRLQTSGGALIRNLQQSCNTNVTNNWVLESFDVSGSLNSYKGKQVVLFFRGTNNNQYQPTDFFVDDVAITAQ